ncbi:hypothetical protein EYR41_006514 [Orbilia oligospora]|uniref:Nephrocystin 3-like N-terminal domain-containing protein n=1 Tax=Orbilia oligospora TaxID=2813651 RepID=A0A8H2HPZ1_ORBOL|nr:hypothetical protein EYR41_006514 [Orbilia oligospora]
MLQSFFTTLATQLANYINDIAPSIQKVIEQYPQIASINHEEQFNQLIFNLLSELADVSQLSQQSSLPTKAVLVIDALDECDREQDQELIVSLSAKLDGIKSIKIYVFLTSRPELPLRISFEKLPGNMHRDMILHKIPGIQEDIATFMEFEFARIRDLYLLPPEWPGGEHISKLAEMAVPLFIFAATACRFIADTDPEEQVEIVMSYQSNWHTSQLEATYLPILHRLKQKVMSISYQTLITEFRKIVGTIINLASPMSIPSLSKLLAVSERKRKCIELMSKRLKKDICDLKLPGIFRSDVDESLIIEHLPTEIQYSCRYWVYHLERSRDTVKDSGIVDVFLRQHTLHWVEAVSLSGEMKEMVHIADALKVTAGSENISALVYDIRRFVRQNQTIIDRTPLQVYWSTLLLAPKKSVLKPIFGPRNIIPEVELTRPLIVQEQWSAVLQTLEGHTSTVTSLVFSANDDLLASGSSDETLRIWDVATGAQLHVFRGHRSTIGDVIFYTVDWVGHERHVNTVAFLGDGKMLASGSDDDTVRIWNAITGVLLHKLKFNDSIYRITFSANANILAIVVRDGTVGIADAATGGLLRSLNLNVERIVANTKWTWRFC